MDEKRSPGEMLGNFFSGKGFYIVLLLCAALIAASVYLMLAEGKTMEEEPAGESEMTMAVLPAPQKPVVRMTPEPKINPEPPAVEETWNVPEAESTAGETLPLYFIWPVSGVLTRDYSEDSLSYDRTMADWRTHGGWDIASVLGGHVLAAADGTVSAVYEDDLYGTTVEINHGCGVVSCYANLADTPTVHEGDAVRVGDVIGAVGDTALCEVGEEYHLHFAMKLNDAPADPANWLPER